MARALVMLISLTILFFIFPQNSHGIFSRNLSPKDIGLNNKLQEKLSHFHFYFHDAIQAKNPDSVIVAEASTTNSSSTSFGEVVMMDDDLTVGPERGSKRVGKAQGIYASASHTDFELLMVFNLVFTEGKYNGSTLSILGRNAVYNRVRELPIVGGSGVFRFARGFAHAKTYSFNLTSLEAVVEYNVYVFHY